MNLPNKLTRGASLKTKSGQIVTVVRIKQRGRNNEETYRLQYMSGIVGHRRWNRDALAAAGCVEV